MPGSAPVSLAVVLVAKGAVAIAADSVYVDLASQGAGVPKRTHRKVLSSPRCIGALTGVAVYNGHDFTDDLLEALEAGSSIHDAAARFTAWSSADRAQAFGAWRSTVGQETQPSAFMQVVLAGRDRIGGELVALELTSVEDGDFEVAQLSTDDGRAYCGL